MISVCHSIWHLSIRGLNVEIRFGVVNARISGSHQRSINGCQTIVLESMIL